MLTWDVLFRHKTLLFILKKHFIWHDTSLNVLVIHLWKKTAATSQYISSKFFYRLIYQDINETFRGEWKITISLKCNITFVGIVAQMMLIKLNHIFNIKHRRVTFFVCRLIEQTAFACCEHSQLSVRMSLSIFCILCVSET